MQKWLDENNMQINISEQKNSEDFVRTIDKIK